MVTLDCSWGELCVAADGAWKCRNSSTGVLLTQLFKSIVCFGHVFLMKVAFAILADMGFWGFE